MAVVCIISLLIIGLAHGSVIKSRTDSTLKFVHVLWRHGDRNPVSSAFPTDTKNPDSSWPSGLGHLTGKGIQQHYDLGTYFRKRYIDSNFLSPDYKTNQVYVISDNEERTIMSAHANLAGLYSLPPPHAHTHTHTHMHMSMDGIPPGEVPVHIAPHHDPILHGVDCSKVTDPVKDKIHKSDEYQRFLYEYRDLVPYLAKETGLHVHSMSTFAPHVYDQLNCELMHNDTHQWPDWVTSEVFEQTTNMYFKSTTFSYHDPILQRYKGSFMFLDIAQRSALAASSNSSQLNGMKYYAYSGHDSTIMPLLENLGAYDGRLPPYASAVIFELRQKTDGAYIMQVYYINKTGSQTPEPLVVQGCSSSSDPYDCPLETFLQLARNKTPTDWKKECGAEGLVGKSDEMED